MNHCHRLVRPVRRDPLLLGLACLLLVSACSSLPRYQEQHAALYLPLEVRDLDGLPLVYAMQPELWRLDEQGVATAVPLWRAPYALTAKRQQLWLDRLPPGRYRLTRLAWVSEPDRGWEGVPVAEDLGGLRYQVDFELGAGELHLLPWLGWLEGERFDRQQAQFRWGVSALTDAQQQALVAQLQRDRRGQQWQVRVTDTQASPQQSPTADAPASDPVAAPAPARQP